MPSLVFNKMRFARRSPPTCNLILCAKGLVRLRVFRSRKFSFRCSTQSFSANLVISASIRVLFIDEDFTLESQTKRFWSHTLAKDALAPFHPLPFGSCDSCACENRSLWMHVIRDCDWLGSKLYLVGSWYGRDMLFDRLWRRTSTTGNNCTRMSSIRGYSYILASIFTRL